MIRLFKILIIVSITFCWVNPAPASVDAGRVKEISVHKISRWVCSSVDNFLKVYNKYDVDIDQQDDKGNTLLLQATKCGNVELVKHLLTWLKALPDVENDDGERALLVAISNDRLDIVTLLLEANAYIHDVDLEALEPKMRALLTEYGAW